MPLKQREANRKALENAAAIIQCCDFTQLFGEDLGDGSEHDDDVMEKAQAYAVRRIESLTRSEKQS